MPTASFANAEITIWVGSVSSHSNESMVIRCNGGRTEKSGEWIK